MMVMLMAVVACSSSNKVPDKAGACEEPRPQMCTREYKPVCGVQENSIAKTYGNACTACSDEKVVFFLQGDCKGKKPQ